MFHSRIHPYQSGTSSYYNSSSVCLCVPYFLRGPLTDLRQTWWVYVGWPPICPWGVLFRKGQRVTFAFHYIIHAPASRHTLQKAPFALLALLQSNSAPFDTLHLNGVCRWTSQLLLRGSFSKRSTGQRVNGSNGSTGQRVTFTFTILYMIADDARLTPPRCKKHTGSTGRQVNGSMGQRLKQVDGSTGHFHYIIYDSRQRQAHATPLQKAHGVWWHQTHATLLQKAHSVFCSLDG